jgi:hypothetical protein
MAAGHGEMNYTDCTVVGRNKIQPNPFPTVNDVLASPSHTIASSFSTMNNIVKVLKLWRTKST